MRALHVVAGNLYGGVERIAVEIASGPADVAARVCALLRRTPAGGAHRTRRAVSHAWRGALQPANDGVACTPAARHRSCATSAFDAIVCHSPWTFALAAPACAARGAFSGRTTRSTARTGPNGASAGSRPISSSATAESTSEIAVSTLDGVRPRAPLSMRRSHRRTPPGDPRATCARSFASSAVQPWRS